MKQEASAVLSRLEWYGMTFWTKLQHELLCFVCAEDEIFDSVGNGKREHSRYRAVIEPWCDKCMNNLFSSTLIQVFPYSANISDMKSWYANDVGDNMEQMGPERIQKAKMKANITHTKRQKGTLTYKTGNNYWPDKYHEYYYHSQPRDKLDP